MAGQRLLEREASGIDELQHDEGEQRLAEGGGVEHGMPVDQRRRAGQPNTLAQRSIDCAVTDHRDGNAGNIA